MHKFVGNSFGDQDAAVQLRKDIDDIHQNELVERTGIGDDDHWRASAARLAINSSTTALSCSQSSQP
jgi:hypothetical protein